MEGFYMKKTIIFTLIFMLLFSGTTFASNINLKVGSNTATIDDKNITLSAAPYIDPKSGRTLVPLRFVAENMGCNVEWNNNSKQIYIKTSKMQEIYRKIYNMAKSVPVFGQTLESYDYYSKDLTNEIILQIDIAAILIGRQYEFKLDQAPVFKDGRTFVPVRAVSEILGYKIDFNPKTKIISFKEDVDNVLSEITKREVKNYLAKTFIR